VVTRVVTRACRLGATAALASLTACGSAPAGHDHHDDQAAWDIGPDQHLTSGSTGFTAIVTRTGCSGGEQGRPVAPVIEAGASTITITFRMEPHISGGTCEGTEGVAYRVHLDEPIGTRMLVDGACRPPGTDGLESTAFCLDLGVRLSWRHGHPHLPVIQ
jgi:hypothetical protein